MTVLDLQWLVEVKRRLAERNSDPVQLRIDLDRAIGQLEEAHLRIRDLLRAIGDVEVLAHDARTDAFAAEQLARMARTNNLEPIGGEGR